MLISSEDGAGQILSPSEDTRFYDDVACLAADWQHRSAGARAFVRLHDGKWIEAGDASFATPATARTAMGSGVMAFATIAEARSSDRDGRVLTFDELVRRGGDAR